MEAAMRMLKILLITLGLLGLAACGGGGSSSSNNSNVAGVDTAAQISVVTAK
jgi:ABC-type glycerol-3-phosphate transport system substrate-binding protein